MTVKSAQGIDVSAYQNDLLPVALASYDFAYCKATEGLSLTDQHFGANWTVLASWGKPRGAYHFLVPSADPLAQAHYFVSVVQAHGLKSTDILVCDSETAARNTDTATREFLTEVRSLCPHNPVVVYASLGFLSSIPSCKGFPLWVADWATTAPVSVAPWPRWVFWQWSAAPPPDRDAFNGTAANLAAWIKTYEPQAPKPVTVPEVSVYGCIGAGEAGRAASWPAGACKTLALFADPSLWAKQPQEVRVAVHSKGKGFSQIETVKVTGVKPVVTFAEHDVDGVSLRRADAPGNWCELAYDLA